MGPLNRGDSTVLIDSNAAPASTGPTYLRVDRITSIPGITAGRTQPAVEAVLELGAPVSPARFAQLEQMLARFLKTSVDSQAAASAPFAACIGSHLASLLDSGGFPLFDSFRARPLDRRQEALSIPVIQGCHQPVGRLLALIAMMMDQWLAGQLPPPEKIKQQFDEALKQLGVHAPRGKNTLTMLNAAQEMGIPWLRLYDSIYLFGQGRAARRMESSSTDRTSRIAVNLAQDKLSTNRYLASGGFPVPRNIPVRNQAQAIQAAEQLGYPVVVKPSDRDRGEGVTGGVRTPEILKEAIATALKFSPNLLVEQHCPGDDHRLHVFEGRVYRARRRTPGGVTGDGQATIRSLLERLNEERRRGARTTHLLQVPLELDEEALQMLEEQGLTPDAVPDNDQFVQLRRIANVSVGGVSAELAVEDIHPDNRRLAERAVNSIGLDIAAVDLLSPDITRSWLEVGAAIIEINAKPQFGADAPRWIFRQYFPDLGRIPISVVISDTSAPEWLLELRNRLHADGCVLGVCSPDGVWVDNTPISAAPSSLYQGALTLVRDSEVACILIVADSGLLRTGLPVDRFDALLIATREQDPETADLIRDLSQMTERVWMATDGAYPAVGTTTGTRTLTPADTVDALATLLMEKGR